MKMKTLAVSILLSLISFSTSALGQANPAITPEMRKDANAAFQAGDWVVAKEAYKKILEIEPTNQTAGYRLGLSFLNLNNHVEAQKPLEKAFSATPNPNFGLALARVYARSGRKNEGFEVLAKSIAFGGVAPETLTREKDFSIWQDDAGFKELIRKSDVAMNPCKASPEFREFDFWIGDWSVRTPQGQVVGSSIVQLVLGQCVIFENWTGEGSAGKSFNFYDTQDKKWHQTWVDDKGAFKHYVGGLSEGKMVLVNESAAGARKTLARMTFSKLPNGDIRQFGENSVDEGKTWTSSFDLIYSRKK